MDCSALSSWQTAFLMGNPRIEDGRVGRSALTAEAGPGAVSQPFHINSVDTL